MDVYMEEPKKSLPLLTILVSHAWLLFQTHVSATPGHS